MTSNCETTLDIELDMSGILAADIYANEYSSAKPEVDLKLKTLVNEFYDTIKPLKSNRFNAQVTALSNIYMGEVFALGIHNEASIGWVDQIFSKLRCFVLNTKAHSFENNQYTVNLSKIFSTSLIELGNTATEETFTSSMKSALKLLNHRFSCLQTKFEL